MPELPLSACYGSIRRWTAISTRSNDLVYAAGVLSKKIKLAAGHGFRTPPGSGVRSAALYYRFGRIEGPCPEADPLPLLGKRL